MSKSKRKPSFTFTHFTILLVAVMSLLATTGCVTMIVATRQSNLLKAELDTAAKGAVNALTEYHTITEVYQDPDKFIGQYVLLSGYFCSEFATDKGVAWLSDQKEMSKEDAAHIIRLERSEPFDYTPKAIAVYGKLLWTDNALVIRDGDFYLYGGTDKEMLKHNALIEFDVVNVVMTALRYDDNTDVSEELTLLKGIACEYEDEQLESLFILIDAHAKTKSVTTREEFETKAEELWNTFRNQLLDR